MKANWARKYPSLLLLALAILLTATVLPSALNLPLPNPSQTLEYAPVPADGEGAPPGGNLSSLGLAFGGGFRKPGSEEEKAQRLGQPGRGGRPSTKRCVGNPPRQTEDPLAPPCVAFFEGNNFGSTYQGVTKDEVRVLAYLDGYPRSDSPDRPVQCETFYDLSQPASPNEGSTETFYIEPIRIYQKYFDERFQTYGRQVHFFAYGSGCGESSPETRKSDAAEVRSQVRPFAVLNFAYGDYAPEFDLAMADSGLMSFGGLPNTLLPASVYRGFPGFLWSYLPSFDQLASLYTSYVCEKVVPYPVSFGNPNEFGSNRKLGLLYTNAPGFPDHLYLRDLVIKQVEACGGKVELSRGFNPSANDAGVAAQNVALFRQQAITTILWTGHGDIAHPQAAGSTGYTPEVIVLGQPLGLDNNLAAGPFGHPAFMSHVWAVTVHTLQGPPKQEQCGLAIHDARPEAADDDLTNACIYYRSIFQMFTGIQVAGPRLTPGSVERGLRAIPPHTSSTAKAPACFYEPGDYTCVKDRAAEWWDTQGRASPPGQSEEVPGCWRMAEKGKRYLVGDWPGGDVLDQKGGANDPCNYVWYG